MECSDKLSQEIARRRVTSLLSKLYVSVLSEQSRLILTAQLVGMPVVMIAERLNISSAEVWQQSKKARLTLKRGLLDEGLRLQDIAHLFKDSFC